MGTFLHAFLTDIFFIVQSWLIKGEGKDVAKFENILSTYTFAGWILWQRTILCKVTKLCRKGQKILTLMPQNCESNVTKLCRYTKKVAWIFLISWLCRFFRFSVILWSFCHKIVSSNVQVPKGPYYPAAANISHLNTFPEAIYNYCQSIFQKSMSKSLVSPGFHLLSKQSKKYLSLFFYFFKKKKKYKVSLP